MTENDEKIKYINIQLIATIGFIGALLVSFVLAYDKELSLKGKKRIFSDKEAQNVALLQTACVLLIAISFLFVNYNQYKISSKYNEKDKNELLLQIVTSILAILSALIGLYIVIDNYNKKTLSISEIESV